MKISRRISYHFCWPISLYLQCLRPKQIYQPSQLLHVQGKSSEDGGDWSDGLGSIAPANLAFSLISGVTEIYQFIMKYIISSAGMKRMKISHCLSTFRGAGLDFFGWYCTSKLVLLQVCISIARSTNNQLIHSYLLTFYAWFVLDRVRVENC